MTFQNEVKTNFRSQQEIDFEKNYQRRNDGVAAFVEATNAPDGGDYGYEIMLETLFKTFQSDHGTSATINTVLSSLKPVIKQHHDIDRLRLRINDMLDEISNG